MTQATTKLVTDLRVLAADAEELVKLTASQTGEKFAAVRDKLQRSLADAKPRLVQAQEQLRTMQRLPLTPAKRTCKKIRWPR